MTDKQIIEYRHTKCTKNDCCIYCGSIFCGYVDDIENLEKAYKAKEQECEMFKEILKDKTDEYNKLAVNYDAYVYMANKQLDQLKEKLNKLKSRILCENEDDLLYELMKIIEE